jgi:DNA-binding GntR family transcriptional regulator
MGSLDDLLAQSTDTEMEIVAPLRTVATPDRATLARLEAEEMMEVRIRRLHDDLPFSVVIVSLPADIGRLVATEPLLMTAGERRRITVLEILDRVLDPPITEARQLVTVDRAPADVAALIDVSPRRSVLRIDRLFIDRSGRVVELAVNYFNPRRYSYRLVLKRGTR